jgi:hypothetical protein
VSRPRRNDTVPEVFRRLAGDFETGNSPLYARLAREYADDPLVAEIAGDRKPTWDLPMRLFGGVHYLALIGEEEDPWSRLGEVLRGRREWLARFVAEQPIQTNEVQRCWALLPAFLSVAGSLPFSLVELGPSAGLNLVWDRYRYRYDGVTWGDPHAGLELTGAAEDGPPRTLFERAVDVRDRVGIDRAPLDVRDEREMLLLQCFVWADQEARLERLRRAIAIARRDPPRIIRGDYVELLPEFLAGRSADTMTVVYHSASTVYVRREDRELLTETIEAAGREGPLAWISYELAGEEVGFDAFALDLWVWPGGKERRLARLDGHGNRMRWL